MVAFRLPLLQLLLFVAIIFFGKVSFFGYGKAGKTGAFFSPVLWPHCKNVGAVFLHCQRFAETKPFTSSLLSAVFLNFSSRGYYLVCHFVVLHALA